MRQQVHDQGEDAEAQGELEREDRAADSDGDQPASPGPGPPDVLETGPAPGGPLGYNEPLRVRGAGWRGGVLLAHARVLAPHWSAGAFQSRSWTMTPLGSVTWNARSPQGSSRNGMVMCTPSARRRASSPSRSSTANARIRPAAWVSRWSSGSKGRPRRRKMTFIPASSRASEAKPSAAISCRKPKWLVRNAAEAGTSATLRDTAEAVICTVGLLGPGKRGDNQHC